MICLEGLPGKNLFSLRELHSTVLSFQSCVWINYKSPEKDEHKHLIPTLKHGGGRVMIDLSLFCSPFFAGP